jgi:TRAP-type mannitol/chloroaromatic compound transport system substrate-binding protein
MMKSTLLMGFVGLSALALTAVTTDANAQDKVRWKMQSAFGSQLPHLGT